jgi:hypothetical protein
MAKKILIGSHRAIKTQFYIIAWSSSKQYLRPLNFKNYNSSLLPCPSIAINIKNRFTSTTTKQREKNIQIFISWSSPSKHNKRILYSIRKQNRNPWLHASKLNDLSLCFFLCFLFFFHRRFFFLHNISIFLMYNSYKKIIILNSYAFYVAYPHRYVFQHRVYVCGSIFLFAFASRASRCLKKRKKLSQPASWKSKKMCCSGSAYACIESNPLFIIYISNRFEIFAFPSTLAQANRVELKLKLS